MTARASQDAETRTAFVRRAFSLSGLLPLGVFLVVHVVVNARVVRGEAAFESASEAIERLPAIRIVELLLVWAPLVVHGVLGLWLIAARMPPAEPNPCSPRVVTTARLSGVIALLFIALHVRHMQALTMGPHLPSAMRLTVLSADLSSTRYGVPWTGLGYLVGTATVTLHFAIGAWAFFARTRIGQDPTLRRWGARASALLGAAIWIFFVDVIVLHATGSRLFGSVAPAASSREPCPANDTSQRTP